MLKMRLRRTAPLFLFLSFLLPTLASAEQALIWDFHGKKLPADRWEVTNLTSVTATDAGLAIKTTQEGNLRTKLQTPFVADTIVFVFDHATPMEARLVWTQKGQEDRTIIRLPFLIGGKPHEEISLDIGQYDEWKTAETVGLEFPANADTVLERIEFHKWTLFEKTAEAWKSFWTFDDDRVYSINFLWGPIFTFNRFERAKMFTSLPPVGKSANILFYVILSIAGIVSLALLFWKRRTAALQTFFFTLAALWVIYDVRMGLEVFSYLADDYRTYWSQDFAHRDFRTAGNFFDVVERSRPYLLQDKRYAFVGPGAPSPYLAWMRYLTYPSLPIGDQDDYGGVRTWLVFQRDDVTVNEKNQLVFEGKTVLIPQGKIIERFGKDSFLYQATP
jgi:hypothetical protein